MSPDKVGLHPSHIAHIHPDFAYPYGNYLWMDPGSETIANWTLAVVRDLVTNYNLSGIHMDDYCYPYPLADVPFPDDSTYGEYLTDGGLLSREDWRRDNVNRFVFRMRQEIKTIKPDVVLTIAPFGIYRAGHPEGHPSPPIIGFDPYTQLYCDAKLWLQEGWPHSTTLLEDWPSRTKLPGSPGLVVEPECGKENSQRRSGIVSDWQLGFGSGRDSEASWDFKGETK